MAAILVFKDEYCVIVTGKPTNEIGLEPLAALLAQFCFTDSATVHAEGGEADVYPSDEAA
jgi:hypothetical protein